MRLDRSAPLIGIPVCVRRFDEQPFHVVGEKYIRAVVDGAAGQPLLIPALGDIYHFGELAERLDGLLFTGSPSNVAVHNYGGPPDRPDSPQDPDRDATTLPLIRAALDRGVPVFCICRGMQELNVALGGTLHTAVHTVSGNLDHRAPKNLPFHERYGERHPVRLMPDGILSRTLGVDEIQVNSLHWQAIDRLAERLCVEAYAADGVIEAVHVQGVKSFALGVQWHPEYRVTENRVSRALFKAFGEAACAFAAARRGFRPERAA